MKGHVVEEVDLCTTTVALRSYTILLRGEALMRVCTVAVGSRIGRTFSDIGRAQALAGPGLATLRRKRSGALDSCFGLVGPHHQSIPSLNLQAPRVIKVHSSAALVVQN